MWSHPTSCIRVLFSFCFLPPKTLCNHLSFLSYVWFRLFLSFLFPDKTCQWHFQYDCAQAKKTVCELWEGERTLCQVFWTVVWVWPGGVRGAPHLPDVSLPARAYKFIPQAHVTAGLYHCAARYFCRQRNLIPLSYLSENYSFLAYPAREVSFRVSLWNRR